MGNCPKCANSISSEFGLTTCESCGETIFVGMDGEAQSEQVSELGLEDPGESQTFVGPSDPNGSETVDSNTFVELPYEEEYEGEDVEGEGVKTFSEEYVEEYEKSNMFEYDTSVPPMEPEVVEKTVFEESDTSINSSFDDHSVEDTVITNEEVLTNPKISDEMESYKPKRELEDLSEIADYGNSTVSQGREGSLLFTVTISGVDSKGLKDAVAESLEDARFLWDYREVMKGLSGGRLVIKKISAVKAAVLLQRLKGLSVSVVWEQNAIYES